MQRLKDFADFAEEHHVHATILCGRLFVSFPWYNLETGETGLDVVEIHSAAHLLQELGY